MTSGKWTRKVAGVWLRQLSPPHSHHLLTLFAVCVFPFLLLLSPSSLSVSVHSVFGLLHRGRTPMSGALLRDWLLAPSLDLETLVRRQNYIELFMIEHDIFAPLYETHMKGLPDCNKLNTKISSWSRRDSSKKLDQEGTIKLIHQAYAISERLPTIFTILKQYRGKYEEMLERDILAEATSELLPTLQKFSELVESSIDLTSAKRHIYRVNPTSDETLMSIDQRINEMSRDMESIGSEMAQSMGLEDSKVKLLHAPSHGWCLRVTRKDEKNLRSKTGLIQLGTLKDGVYFTTPNLRACAESRRELEQQYSVAQEGVVLQIMELVGTYLTCFERINTFITELDVFIGIAHAANNSGTAYVRPTLLPIGSGVIEFTQARHPCVESAAINAAYIPNDVTMEKETSRFQSQRDTHTHHTTAHHQMRTGNLFLTTNQRSLFLFFSEHTHITAVTGPNMGGKVSHTRSAMRVNPSVGNQFDLTLLSILSSFCLSLSRVVQSTYIRMVGVLCVMAQIGSPLPCASGRVSLIERVLARVGAGDNAQKGVSTFMAEMIEASTILKDATENSLIIIDELGQEQQQ